MLTYDLHMAISVTEFRANCLELIRRVEAGGEAIDIKRRGRVVARLSPPPPSAEPAKKPWERLRGSGQLLAEPGESVLQDEQFEASR
jgi:antitoxin (DNA-binding transcriptional repressor) of toxin-antitoxin stability system